MVNEKKPAFSVCTLGCKVNQYESDCISTEFLDKGYVKADFDEVCDVYVINTCVVTQNSEKKSRQMIRRAKKKNPDAIIAVCGCFSELYKEKLEKLIPCDIILGNTNKTLVAEISDRLLKEKSGRKYITDKNIDELTIYEDITAKISEHTRAAIKICDGCDHVCTYCIIPQVRGKVRSRTYENIYSEVKFFNDAGYHEIVLTGIEIASYGKDFRDIDLITLLEKLDSETELDNIISIRLGSLDPSYLKKDFVDRFAKLKKAAHHFHLSLQSGSDMVLRLMKRRYNSSMIYDYIGYAKKTLPNIVLTADMIVGFPGENDEDLALSENMMCKLELYHTHIFTYSKRSGTPAEKFDGQIDESEKNKRSLVLSKVNGELKKEILEKNLGKTFSVISEDFDGVYFNAKTSEYLDIKVDVKGNSLKSGDVVLVKSVSNDDIFLYTEVI